MFFILRGQQRPQRGPLLQEVRQRLREGSSFLPSSAGEGVMEEEGEGFL